MTDAAGDPPLALRRRPAIRLLGAVAVVVLFAPLLTTGCGDGTRARVEGPYSRMEQGLSRAWERARAGDAEGARREFLDNAHDPLHRLAAEAAQRDRAAAAELLEAKHAVEASLEEAGPTLADDLTRLRRASTAAVAAVDRGSAQSPG